MTLANELGSVLASEQFCDLSFDQAAIRSFIETHVKADDMSFPGMLGLMTTGHETENKDMSTSQKTAHCAQIARVAKAYGFVR